ncbi:hypothetical protein GCM10009798_02920 [Nocardioides panacihumi]|uniref:Uncharacterized protein n=1 Tax=Nocardioides panacihumi TaxID=400774 RepID=A0ABN2Q8W6_9ACTN
MSSERTTTAADLVSAVRDAAAGTPYVVQETARGFDLTIDVANARWLAVLRAHGLKKVFTHEVTLDVRRRRLVIVDVSNTLSWSAGAPRLATVQKEASRGRIYQKSWRKDFGVDLDTGRVGEVVGYSFDAGVGRDMIRTVAKAHGWSERMGGVEKGAIVMAAIGLVGGLAGAVVAVVQR